MQLLTVWNMCLGVLWLHQPAWQCVCCLCVCVCVFSNVVVLWHYHAGRRRQRCCSMQHRFLPLGSKAAALWFVCGCIFGIA